MGQILDKYAATIILLLTAAILFVATPIFFRFGDFATAAFVIAGMTCTILGSFIVMFLGNEPIDPRIVGLLPIQNCMTLCRIASDAGINGNAYFLPSRITGSSRAMQFNPVSTYDWGMVSTKESFAEEKPPGLITITASDPLIQVLYKRHSLVIPNRVNELNELLSETLSDTLEFAPRVDTIWRGDSVTIMVYEYRFIEGCLLMQSASPYCCTRYPCPTCSLCGTLIAECVNKVVSLQECTISSKKNITMTFLFT